MAYAILDGIELCKFRDYRNPDGLLADEARTANGSFRRDVTAMTQSWQITLGHLNADEFAIIRNHLRSHLGRSLYWDKNMGGTYPQDAVPVVVRMSTRTVPGPSMAAENRGIATPPYWMVEAFSSGVWFVPPGELGPTELVHLTTEDGQKLVFDHLQPLHARDFMGGEITLTITQVHANAPGGGWANTLGTEAVLIPGPAGPPGPQGPAGQSGPPGSSVLTGNGPPEETPGLPGDVYIDANTGDVYRLD